MERKPGQCRMCLNDAPVRNINLYIWGSEGLEVCEECEVLVVSYVRAVSAWHLGRQHEYRKALRTGASSGHATSNP